jgi:hypothetical protein
MAYAHSFVDPRALALPQKTARLPQRNWLNRLLHFIEGANMRRAEAEIAKYLESTGGKFTDSTEREIEQRFLSTLVR